MTQLQIELLAMLKDIKYICINNNISYYLCFGTLLGAIRHKGFIPWDDDVDIMMDQVNYRKFINIVENDVEFNKKYFFQNPSTDKNTQCPWGKVRKNNTCMVLEGDNPFNMHMGIWIDIFPLYDARRNKISQFLQGKASKMQYIMTIDIIKCNKKIRIMRKILCTFIKRNLIIATLNKIIMYQDERSNSYLIMGEYLLCPIINKNILENELLAEFENELFSIPTKYDELLKNTYGDYMKLPEMKNRISHAPMILDLFNSYENYLEELIKITL